MKLYYNAIIFSAALSLAFSHLSANTSANIFYTVDQGSGDQSASAMDSGAMSASVDKSDVNFMGLPDSAVGSDTFASAQIIPTGNAFQIELKSKSTLIPTNFVSQDLIASANANLIFQVNRTSGSGPIPLVLVFEFDGILTDLEGIENPTGSNNTFVDGSFGQKLFDKDGNIIVDTFAGGFIDGSNSFVPFSGGFDGMDSFSNSTITPGVEDFTFMGDRQFNANDGDRLNLQTDFSAPIFTDGFESGDTSAWAADFSNTYVLTVIAPSDAVVTIVPEPSQLAALLSFGLLMAIRLRRR